MDHMSTSILVISDTHAEHLEHQNLPPVDVAIHCGDLTDESKLAEFRQAIELMKRIPAKTKLVIAGNHDFTLDPTAYHHLILDKPQDLQLDPLLVKKEFGEAGEAKKLLLEAAADNLTYLEEGAHKIPLPNGALLTVFASPQTPSESNWGFTYPPRQDPHWQIQEGIDIVITHGPPRGVLDYSSAKQRAGSQSLFAAVAQAQPKLHCFGHIHEGWGAKLIHWRARRMQGQASHFTYIDNDRSRVVETLATLQARNFDDPETLQEKELKRAGYYETGFCRGNAPAQGQTLFVNAAILSKSEEDPQQLPWIVDIDLPKSK